MATVYPTTASHEDGRRFLVYSFTEASVSGSSETTLAGVPAVGTIVSHIWELTGGSGATLNPEWGTAATWSTTEEEHLGTNTTTAAYGHETTPLPFYADSGSLYLRSQADTGSDNTTAHRVIIAVGVQS